MTLTAHDIAEAVDEVVGTPFFERLRQLAAADPTAPAVTSGAETLTRAALLQQSEVLARDLLALGVRPGDFVTILLPNGVEPVVATFACWAVGAVPQPLSAKLSARELREILDLTRPRVVLGLDDPPFDGVVTLPAGYRPSGLARGPLPTTVSPAWKAPTSGGSTGRPKVIVAGAPAIWERVSGFAELLRLPASGVVLVTAPMSHNAPFLIAHLAILQGGHAVAMPRFDAEDVLRHVEQHQVSWVYAVPTMMMRMWRLPEAVRSSYDVSSVSVLMHMAAPCPPAVKRAFFDWFGPDRVLELYAGTEVQAVTIIDGNEWLAHPGSVGRPVVGRLEVRDESGDPLPPGEIGRIWMRRDDGAPPTYLYIGAEAESDAAGWETLGDRGWLDRDGYVYLADRDSDMIIVGGVNVYPAEIESVLQQHPAVLEACVVGVPHAELGQVPHAFVRLTDHVDTSQLLDVARHELARHKVPRTVDVVTQPLRDDAGKLRRSSLTSQARQTAQHASP